MKLTIINWEEKTIREVEVDNIQFCADGIHYVKETSHLISHAVVAHNQLLRIDF